MSPVQSGYHVVSGTYYLASVFGLCNAGRIYLVFRQGRHVTFIVPFGRDPVSTQWTLLTEKDIMMAMNSTPQ